MITGIFRKIQHIRHRPDSRFQFIWKRHRFGFCVEFCKKTWTAADCGCFANSRKSAYQCGKMGIDILCFTGHKGLFGPQGTGGLYVREGLTFRL